MNTMYRGMQERAAGFARGGRAWIAGGLLVGSLLPATAATQSFSLTPDLAVPDGNASGTFSQIVVPNGTGVVQDVNLKMSLAGTGAGGWNGDLFILLSHSGVASYVLNRPGKSLLNPLGYGDNGFLNITFDDDVAGDSHLYQAVQGAPGDSPTPITGTLQPDGRSQDPFFVVDTDARNFLLDVFDNRPADGPWRLLLFDLSPGGTFKLVDWELQLTFRPGEVVIPETGRGVVLAAGLVVGLCWHRWRSRARQESAPTTPASTPV